MMLYLPVEGKEERLGIFDELFLRGGNLAAPQNAYCFVKFSILI
jgi:hypothetical protein